MRLLHVTETFGAGVGEVVRILAERQAERGEQVAIVYGLAPEAPP
jgi:hypothetical protein